MEIDFAVIIARHVVFPAKKEAQAKPARRPMNGPSDKKEEYKIKNDPSTRRERRA
jgi:hypothetical protein